MKWGELRDVIQAAGVKDDETIEFFDREMFNELVQLYRALDTPMAKTKTDALMDGADWVDGLRDRYVTAGDRSWHDGIGFPYSYGDGRVVVIRDDDPEAHGGWGAGDGIVKVYFSSVMQFERPERYLEARS